MTPRRFSIKTSALIRSLKTPIGKIMTLFCAFRRGYPFTSGHPNLLQWSHLTLQRLLNDVEPELRTIVMSQLRQEFGDNWSDEVLRHAASHLYNAWKPVSQCRGVS